MPGLLVHAETTEARDFYLHLVPEFEASPTDELHLFHLEGHPPNAGLTLTPRSRGSRSGFPFDPALRRLSWSHPDRVRLLHFFYTAAWYWWYNG